MKYTEKREELSGLRAKYRTAKKELEGLESSIEPLQEKFQDSYIQLTEKRAEAEIGDASKAEVTKAENRNQDIKAKIQVTKEAIDTKKHVVRLLSEKMEEAQREFNSVAQEYHINKLEPHFNGIDKALDSINNEIQAINEYRIELQKDQMIQGSFLKGIDRGSEALISKKQLASIDKRNFLTQTKQ